MQSAPHKVPTPASEGDLIGKVARLEAQVAELMSARSAEEALGRLTGSLPGEMMSQEEVDSLLTPEVLNVLQTPLPDER